MSDKESLCLGISTHSAALDGVEPTLIIDNPVLKAASHHRLFLGRLKNRFEIDVSPRKKTTGTKNVPLSLFGKHGIIVGASGSGKSFLALHLLREQLAAGYSAVVIDVKTKTLERALSFALEAGLNASQITTILPSNSYEGMPAWNPLLGDVSSIRERVSEFKDILRLGSDSWGPRMDNLLESALTVMAAQGLSLLEMYEFLLDSEYRAALLDEARGTPVWDEFRLRFEYFEREFPTIAKTESVQAVLSRIRMLVDNRFLRTLFCAAGDTLNLPSLWQQQRLILVHMDSSAIGDEGVRFLAGLLSESLLRAALKHSGPVPVLLFLDEMGYQGSYLDRSLTKILAIAREQNLRLLIAAQHLGQLTSDLKEAALTSTAFRAFFRLGDSDADYVAKRIGYEIKDEVRRVAVIAEDTMIRYEYTVEAFHRENARYESVYTRLYKQDPPRLGSFPEATVNIWRYFIYLRMCGYFISKATPPVVHGKTPRRLVSTHLNGLSDANVEVGPFGYAIIFPEFKVNVIKKATRSERLQEITHMLTTMPPQHAIIRSDVPNMQYIEVLNVTFPEAVTRLENYCTTGQSEQEIRDNFEQRLTIIARLKRGAGVLPTTLGSTKQKSKSRAAKLGVFRIPELRDFPYTSRLEAPEDETQAI